MFNSRPKSRFIPWGNFSRESKLVCVKTSDISQVASTEKKREKKHRSLKLAGNMLPDDWPNLE